MAQINRENPITDRGNTARAVPIRQSLAGSFRDAVVSLLVAVAFLLLIACANVSNLLLVKASARKREIAVRTALGATRRRLVRQLFSESVVLGVAGGIGGLLLVCAGLPALLALVPVELPHWMNFSADYRVLLFAIGVSILTSVVFGIVPAFTISGDVTDALKEAGRTGMASLRQRFARNALVIAEVALSVTLLIGAGLMIRSFLALRNQNLGYRAENVLTMRVSPPEPNTRMARRLASFCGGWVPRSRPCPV
jgi:cell division protein FtsX